MIKGVIFDFNGVLFFDNEFHEQAWFEYARKLRAEPFTKEEMRVHMHGKTNKDICEYLLGTSISSEEASRMAEEKESLYRHICLAHKEQFQLSLGSEKTFNYLEEHTIPFTIATSSDLINIQFFFENLPLSTWFTIDHIIYNDNSFKGKPAPDIYLKAAALLHQKPEDCLVVEDAVSGIAAAHAAGIGTIIALGPKEKHADLLQLEGVSYTIETLTEIQNLPIFKAK